MDLARIGWESSRVPSRIPGAATAWGLAALLLAAPAVYAVTVDARGFPGKIDVEFRGKGLKGTVIEIGVEFVPAELLPPEAPPGAAEALVLEGFLARPEMEPRAFRYRLPAPRGGKTTFRFFQALPPGSASLALSLVVPLPQGSMTSMTLGAAEVILKVPEMTTDFVPAEGESFADAEAILLEEAAPVPEGRSLVRILPPVRDISPTLFKLRVEADPSVARVEFFVAGNKVMARTRPPWEAELDVGKYPDDVEIKVAAYDGHGRFLDSDVLRVSERYRPLTVKILRLAEGMKNGVRFKIAVKPERGVVLARVSLYGDESLMKQWSAEPGEPYVLDVPAAAIAKLRFLRAEAKGTRGEEGDDLYFFDGSTVSERVEVSSVTLPITALDARGALVSDLKRQEFVVREDGKPMAVDVFELAESLPLSLGLLIDTSGSMEDKFDAVKQAAADFASRLLRPGDRAFAGTFSFVPELVVPMTGDRAAIEQAITGLRAPIGGTSIFDAMIAALYRFRGIEGRRALVVLTDGEDTTSRLTAKAVAEYCAVARVPVYFIAIKLPVAQIFARRTLNELAENTGGRVFPVSDAKDLPEVYRRLEAELRTQYLLSYKAPPKSPLEKFRRVEVKVLRPGVTVRTLRGYVP